MYLVMSSITKVVHLNFFDSINRVFTSSYIQKGYKQSDVVGMKKLRLLVVLTFFFISNPSNEKFCSCRS